LIPWPSRTKKNLKVSIHSFSAGHSALKGKCEDRPASSLVVSMGKALYEIASTF